MLYITETHIAKIDSENPDPHTMALAGQIILDGGLVAFPTETVYGLGANALDSAAVGHIFEAKERPAYDPLIAHIWETAQLKQLAITIPDIAYTLADAFWPGPLTMVLKRHPRVPENVSAGLNTIAVRMPSHPVALALLRKAGVPIAAPSANRFSRPSPTTAAHVLQDLEGRVDIVLDAGSTQIGVESTIVNLTSPVPVLLRPGGVSLEALREYLPTLAFEAQYVQEGETAPAPGTLLKHYSPQAEVCLFAGEEALVLNAMCDKANEDIAAGLRVGIMLRNSDASAFEGMEAQIVLLGKDDESMAASLFAGMRALDTAGVDVILVRAPQQTGIGLALYDRLLRAAEGRVIEV